MKALSVHQPYAELIRLGRKTIELRSRATSHRGLVAIVSTKRAPDPALCRRYGLNPDVLPLGMLRCVVDVIDTRPATRDDAPAACCSVDPRDVAIVLGEALPCLDVEVRGKQGWYSVDDALVQV